MIKLLRLTPADPDVPEEIPGEDVTPRGREPREDSPRILIARIISRGRETGTVNWIIGYQPPRIQDAVDLAEARPWADSGMAGVYDWYMRIIGIPGVAAAATGGGILRDPRRGIPAILIFIGAVIVLWLVFR
jgi:hypothetical protein